MGQLRVMGREGDLKTVWDPEKPDEVAGAKAQFDAMTAPGKGYHAYAVKRNGDKGERITEFDPDAAKIILAPQMRGGSDVIGPREALAAIGALIGGLKEHQKATPTRATALAITKLEEAEHWLQHTDSTEPR